MAANNIRRDAADLLLERGVRFNIRGASFLLRLLRLNRIHIRPLKLGTIAEISRLMDTYKLMGVDLPKEVNMNLDKVAYVVAVAILNDKRRIAWFSRWLANLLLWQMPAGALLEIYAIVSKVNKILHFITITNSLETIAQMLMSPKNLGRERNGR